jgi:hypothetical protein
MDLRIVGYVAAKGQGAQREMGGASMSDHSKEMIIGWSLIVVVLAMVVWGAML